MVGPPPVERVALRAGPSLREGRQSFSEVVLVVERAAEAVLLEGAEEVEPTGPRW